MSATSTLTAQALRIGVDGRTRGCRSRGAAERRGGDPVRDRVPLGRRRGGTRARSAGSTGGR